MAVEEDGAAAAARLACEFLAAWSAHDAAALGPLFAADGDFVNVTGLWWHGPERIVRVHATAFDTYFARAALEEERLEARALGPEAGLARMKVRMSGQIAPDGNPAEDRRAMLLAVVRRGPEGWRIAAMQTTDVAPGAETMVADAAGLHPASYPGA